MARGTPVQVRPEDRFYMMADGSFPARESRHTWVVPPRIVASGDMKQPRQCDRISPADLMPGQKVVKGRKLGAVVSAELIEVSNQRPAIVEYFRFHTQRMSIRAELRQRFRSRFTVHPIYHPGACKEIEKLIGSVGVVVGIDEDMIEAHRPVIGDPLQQIGALVPSTAEYARHFPRLGRPPEQRVQGQPQLWVVGEMIGYAR